MAAEKLTISIQTAGTGTEQDPFHLVKAELKFGEAKLSGLLLQGISFMMRSQDMLPLVVIAAVPGNVDFEFDGPAEVKRLLLDRQLSFFPPLDEPVFRTPADLPDAPPLPQGDIFGRETPPGSVLLATGAYEVKTTDTK